MRKRCLTSIAVLVAALVVTSVLAEPPQVGTRQFSVFLSDVSYSSTASEGSSYGGGAGLALGYVWAPRLSTDLSVLYQRNRRAVSTFSTGPAARSYNTLNTYPVDLITHYHLGNSSRWTPRVGLGIRYVGSVGRTSFSQYSVGGVVTESITSAIPSRTSGEVSAGVTFHLGRSTDLLFDVNRLIRSDGIFYDPLTRASGGIAWRF